MSNDEIVNIIDAGDVHSVIHMCTDIFRIIGTGHIYMDDWDGSTPIDVNTNDNMIKHILETTLKDVGGIPNIPLPVLTGTLLTKKEFDELYPNAILFRIALYGLDHLPLSERDAIRVRKDLSEWDAFSGTFLSMLKD